MRYSLPLPSSLPRSGVNCNGTITSEIEENVRLIVQAQKLPMQQSSFLAIHKVGTLTLLKFENKLDVIIHHIKPNQMHYKKFNCININSAVIYFQFISILSCTKHANVANLVVHHGENRMRFWNRTLQNTVLSKINSCR